MVPGAAEGGTIDVLLRHLGVREMCDFIESDALYRVVIDDDVLDAPFGAEAFIESHVRPFPHEEKGIRGFFGLCEQFLAEAHQVPVQLSPKELGQAVERFPTLFGHRMSTLGDVLDSFIDDPRCKAFCSAGWPYMGLPPSQLSFELFARFLFTQMHGLYHCKGGFQNLVKAFTTAIERGGGRIVTGSAVERILIRDGRTEGVVLAGGQELRAPVVISNADAKHTFEDLVGLEHLPKAYNRRLRSLKGSMSMFVVYAATTLDIAAAGGAHETFIYETDDHDRSFAGFSQGLAPATVVVVPTMLDPTLGPPGEHLVTSTALAPYEGPEPWAELKPKLEEKYLDLIERLYPGFRAGLTFSASATPLTLERYTGNHRGAEGGDEVDARRGRGEMAGHGLRGAHAQPVGVRPEQLPDGHGLAGVVARRGGPVGGDVVDAPGAEPRLGQRVPHRRDGTSAVRRGVGDPVRVERRSVAGELAVDPGAAGHRTVPVLQYGDHRALAEDEAGPVGVEGTGRALGLVVPAVGDGAEQREAEHVHPGRQRRSRRPASGRTHPPVSAGTPRRWRARRRRRRC